MGLKELLSTKGRLSREEYILFSFFPIGMLLIWLMFLLGKLDAIYSAIYIIIIIVVQFFLIARRFHDLNRALGSYVNVSRYFSFYLLFFKRGIKGPNEYGEDPSKPALESKYPYILICYLVFVIVFVYLIFVKII